MVSDQDRVLVWFSCSVPSTVAAKLAIERYGKDRCHVLYCDTRSEHRDNVRYRHDVEDWLGIKVKVLKSGIYRDVDDVIKTTRYIKGPAGARCTTELKKVLRFDYQEPDDIHVFGYTLDEIKRVDTFKRHNPELLLDWILVDNGLTRDDCFGIFQQTGIEMPVMYKLNYKNNNCLGCVKGGMGYWNRVRIDFPEVFKKRAQQERSLKFAINRKKIGNETVKVFLDELDPNDGNYKAEPSISCGPQCELQNEEVKRES